MLPSCFEFTCSCSFILNDFCSAFSLCCVLSLFKFFCLVFLAVKLLHRIILLQHTNHMNFVQTFRNKGLAHSVQKRNLDSLITELLLWLLHERVPHMDGWQPTFKSLMLNILVKTYLIWIQIQ